MVSRLIVILCCVMIVAAIVGAATDLTIVLIGLFVIAALCGTIFMAFLSLLNQPDPYE